VIPNAPSQTPLVSVVIPHYNRSDLLRSAVDSVLSSSEQAFEIIVVDDGSSAEHARGAAMLESERVRRHHGTMVHRDETCRGES